MLRKLPCTATKYEHQAAGSVSSGHESPGAPGTNSAASRASPPARLVPDAAEDGTKGLASTAARAEDPPGTKAGASTLKDAKRWLASMSPLACVSTMTAGYSCGAVYGSPQDSYAAGSGRNFRAEAVEVINKECVNF